VIAVLLDFCVLLDVVNNVVGSADGLRIHNRRLYLCIGHRPPLFDVPPYVNLIQTADFPTNQPSLSVRRYLQDKRITPPTDYLFDYAAIPIYDKLSELKGEVDAVVTLVHRKICTTRPHGNPAKNLPHSWLCPAKAMDVDAELMLIANDTLYPHPQYYRQGVMAAYGQYHVIQDYLRIAAICLDNGMISTDELMSMTSANVLFWCPGVGSLSYAGAVDLYGWAAQYIKIVHESGYRCQLPEHPYQKRAISFFAERLLSHKLMSWLLQAGIISSNETGECVIKKSNIGYLCNCIEDGESMEIQNPGLH